MRNHLLLLPALGLAATLTAGGCSQGTVEETVVPIQPAVSISLCGHCGHVKGSETCCTEGCETCDKCNLHKGSPGCCKISAGSDVQLCGQCGQAKGSEACCAADAETCSDCGMHKGAPGCCLKETVAETADVAGEEGDALENPVAEGHGDAHDSGEETHAEHGDAQAAE